ncbi:MAG TPA: hypothetical protein VGF86_06085 [Candidatus Tumulicola sp.]|jgi:hypothetical protein
MTDEFVAAIVFDLLPASFEGVSREAAQFAQSATPRISGLIEIALLGNEGRTRILVLSRWQSKDAWAESRWDQELGKTMVTLVQSSTAFNSETFVPIAIDFKNPPST